MTTGTRADAYRWGVAEVRGLESTVRAIQATPRAVRDAAFRELHAAAAPIVSRAKVRAPRSAGGARKGRNKVHLEDSIRAVVRPKGILVGSRLEYAMVVHFGRSATQRSRSGTPYTRRLEPTPWLYPAIEDGAFEVRAKLKQALERALDALWSAPTVEVVA